MGYRVKENYVGGDVVSKALETLENSHPEMRGIWDRAYLLPEN
jgi:hypothetical protein